MSKKIKTIKKVLKTWMAHCVFVLFLHCGRNRILSTTSLLKSEEAVLRTRKKFEVMNDLK